MLCVRALCCSFVLKKTTARLKLMMNRFNLIHKSNPSASAETHTHITAAVGCYHHSSLRSVHARGIKDQSGSAEGIWPRFRRSSRWPIHTDLAVHTKSMPDRALARKNIKRNMQIYLKLVWFYFTQCSRRWEYLRPCSLATRSTSGFWMKILWCCKINVLRFVERAHSYECDTGALFQYGH